MRRSSASHAILFKENAGTIRKMNVPPRRTSSSAQDAVISAGQFAKIVTCGKHVGQPFNLKAKAISDDSKLRRRNGFAQGRLHAAVSIIGSASGNSLRRT
jgi:hypothetical protein